MTWVGVVIGLSVCFPITAAIAGADQPVMEPPAANLTGSWSIIVAPVGGFDTGVDNHGQTPGSRSFEQTGTRLRGSCKTI